VPARDRETFVDALLARRSGFRDASHQSVAEQFLERGIETAWRP
jgi:hypothetical protein